ncbi:MAG: hypothetical protein IJ991_06690, partial [Thermoguttaceae bacterium]|nr:hypothetical protein [Thermoguttaceae bacterium]
MKPNTRSVAQIRRFAPDFCATLRRGRLGVQGGSPTRSTSASGNASTGAVSRAAKRPASVGD